MNLAEASKGRDNNLNLLRFVAASAVIGTHTLSITGAHGADPALALFGTGMGDLGVNAFFVISGFLIAKSWSNKSNLVDFCWARFVRIFPALWASSLLFVIVCAMAFSARPVELLTSADTVRYLVQNGTMLPGFGAQLVLPGAVEGWEGDFNLPLWTLPHELQMYALVVVLGVAGLIRAGWVAVLIAGVSFCCWFGSGQGWLDVDEDRARLIYCFFIGVVALNFSEQVQISRRSAIVSLMVSIPVFALTPENREHLLMLFLPLWIACLAYLPSGAIRAFNRVGDYSYGLYILGYPIQVILFAHFGVREPLPHLLASLATTLLFASASWHLLESRALRWPQPELVGRMRGAIARRAPFLNRGVLGAALE